MPTKIIIQLRRLVFIIFFCFISGIIWGQNADSARKPSSLAKDDSVNPRRESRDTVPQSITTPQRTQQNAQRSAQDSTAATSRKPSNAPLQTTSQKDSSVKEPSIATTTTASKQQTIPDSIQPTVSVVHPISPSTPKEHLELTQRILGKHPFFNFAAKAAPPPYTPKVNPPGKEYYFYTLAALLLIFAILKTGFDKYYSNLIQLFFKRSLKQRQIKQQLIQNSLPSLLFNLFFIIAAGFYLTLIVHTFAPSITYPFWKILAGSCIILGGVYLAKFLFLKFMGWVFQITSLTDNYIFLIFLINKILILVILPLTLIIALSDKGLATIGWTLSWVLIGGLILYRYISALNLIRKEKAISFFHFLIYVAALEIVPTMVLYKGILSILK